MSNRLKSPTREKKADDMLSFTTADPQEDQEPEVNPAPTIVTKNEVRQTREEWIRDSNIATAITAALREIYNEDAIATPQERCDSWEINLYPPAELKKSTTTVVHAIDPTAYFETVISPLTEDHIPQIVVPKRSRRFSNAEALIILIIGLAIVSFCGLKAIENFYNMKTVIIDMMHE
jgi:hypothetical protein